MLIRGWVYVITNKAMPGLCKVGFSTKDPVLRAKELGGGGTGSPYPYIVIYDVLVENPMKVEQAVHRLLKDKREGKEWFRCSVSEAVRAVREKSGNILNERIWSAVELEDCCYKDCGETAFHECKEKFYCDKHYPYCDDEGCEEKATDECKEKLYCDKHHPRCDDESCEEKATDEYEKKLYCNEHYPSCCYASCGKKATHEQFKDSFCDYHPVCQNCGERGVNVVYLDNGVDRCFYCDKHHPRCDSYGYGECKEKATNAYMDTTNELLIKTYCDKHRPHCNYKDCKEEVTNTCLDKTYCDKHRPHCNYEGCKEKVKFSYIKEGEEEYYQDYEDSTCIKTRTDGEEEFYCDKHCPLCEYDNGDCKEKATYEWSGGSYCDDHPCCTGEDYHIGCREKAYEKIGGNFFCEEHPRCMLHFEGCQERGLNNLGDGHYLCDEHYWVCYCEEEGHNERGGNIYCDEHYPLCDYGDCKEKWTREWNSGFYCDKHPLCRIEGCEEKATDRYNGESYCNKHHPRCDNVFCIEKATNTYFGKPYCNKHHPRCNNIFCKENADYKYKEKIYCTKHYEKIKINDN